MFQAIEFGCSSAMDKSFGIEKGSLAVYDSIQL
jgi:hypothetical protein